MSGERVARGFAWNHLYKIVEYGLTNLYTALVIRKFGPELSGNYAVYLSISGTLAILGAFGVDGVLLRYLPRIARGEKQIGETHIGGVRPFLTQLLAFRLVITIVIAGVMACVLGVLPHYSTAVANALGSTRVVWPYLILFLLGQALVAFSTFTLIGLLQVKWVFFASLISRGILIAVGLFVVLGDHLTIQYAAGLHAITALINGLLLLGCVYYYVEPHTKHTKEVRVLARHVIQFVRTPRHFRTFIVLPFMLYGLTTWGSDLLSTVLGRQPDILMMRALLGENARDIGLYQSAAQLVLMTEYIFLFGLGGTLVSVFSELAHADEEDQRRSGRRYPRLYQARRDVAGFQTVTTAPLFGAMLAFAPVVVPAIYGVPFTDASPIVVAGIAILSMTVILFSGGMQITSLVVIGKERVVFRNRLCWGLANLVANYFLIQRWGAMGAMIGTQAANAGACCTEWIIAGRLIGNSTDLRRTSVIVGVVTLSVIAAVGIISLVPVGLPAMVRGAIGLTAVGCITLVGYYLLRVPDALKVLGKVRSLMVRVRPA